MTYTNSHMQIYSGMKCMLYGTKNNNVYEYTVLGEIIEAKFKLYFTLYFIFFIYFEQIVLTIRQFLGLQPRSPSLVSFPPYSNSLHLTASAHSCTTPPHKLR